MSLTHHKSTQATSSAPPAFHVAITTILPPLPWQCHHCLTTMLFSTSCHCSNPFTFLALPLCRPITSITKATKVKAQTNRGLLTKDNFYGNGDCCRGIPSCCHPSPGHTTSNTNNHHTSLHSTCQHHTSCHPNTNPRYVILNTFPFHSPASPKKKATAIPTGCPYSSAPTNSWLLAIPLKPFSTLVLKRLTRVIATTTKICTTGCSTLGLPTQLPHSPCASSYLSQLSIAPQKHKKHRRHDRKVLGTIDDRH